jgi:large subunit ribosomal protein L3
MSIGIIGTKVGMTQVYDAQGNCAPVTVIQAGPCPILQVRTKEKDGYEAIQVGYKDKSRKRATRAERGHVSEEMESKRRKRLPAGTTLPPKANCEPQEFIKEFRFDKAAERKVGDKLTVSEIFGEVKRVDVIGTTKGRGFTGTMKRWNFAGLPASHGVKKVHRSVGGTNVASNRGFGRPKKGKKMPGQYGAEQVTIRNLDVINIDAENNIILVRGAVPGPNGGVVVVRPTNKIK